MGRTENEVLVERLRATVASEHGECIKCERPGWLHTKGCIFGHVAAALLAADEQGKAAVAMDAADRTVRALAADERELDVSSLRGKFSERPSPMVLMAADALALAVVRLVLMGQIMDRTEASDAVESYGELRFDVRDGTGFLRLVDKLPPGAADYCREVRNRPADWLLAPPAPSREGKAITAEQASVLRKALVEAVRCRVSNNYEASALMADIGDAFALARPGKEGSE